MGERHPVPRQGRTVDFIQHIRAGTDAIWAALTTREGLASWLHATDADIPPAPGADFYIRWSAPGMTSGTDDCDRGTVLAYEPPRYLALEWHASQMATTTYLSFHVQPSFYPYGKEYENDTDLHLIHSGFPEEGPDAFEYDGALRHWRQVIGELAAELEGRPGKPIPYSLAGLKFVGGLPGKGLLIRDVIAGSPADKAGIRPGELLRAVDGAELSSLDDFHAWIDGKPAGVTGVFRLSDREVKVTIADVAEVRRLAATQPPAAP